MPAWNTAPEEVSTCHAPDARVIRPARLRNASTPPRDAKLAQKPLMDRADVHIERVIFHGGAGRVAVAQRRQHRRGLGDRDPAQAGALRDGLIQYRHLFRRREEQHHAVAQQWDAGETIRRRLEESARQPGQQPHIRRPVIRGPKRGRAAGRVVPGLLLRLHQRDAAMFATGTRRSRRPPFRRRSPPHRTPASILPLSPGRGMIPACRWEGIAWSIFHSWRHGGDTSGRRRL